MKRLPLLLFALLCATLQLSYADVQSDLEELSPGMWYEIQDTQLQNAAYDWSPNTPPGNTGIRSVVGAWSGGVFDPAGNRLIIWGGGHQDYGGNEIYAFNFNHLAWEIVANPSTYAIIQNATGEAYYADGLPASIHTYNQLVYNGYLNGLCHIGGAGPYPGVSGTATVDCFDFDVDVNSWGRFADSPVGGHQTTARNPSNDHIFTLGVMNENNLYEFNPNTDSWTKRSADDIYDFNYKYHTRLVVDTGNKHLIAFGLGNYYKWDLSNYTEDGHLVLLSDSSTGPQDVVNTSNPTGDYDTVSGHVVSWVEGKGVFYLNTLSDTWRYVAGDPTSPTPPAPTSNGVFGRWAFMQALNAFCLYTGEGISENVWVYKFSEGTAPVPGDTEAPNIAVFDVAVTADSYQVAINDFTATDNEAVTAYYIGESSTQPQLSDSGWSSSPPSSLIASTDGNVTFYAWARDAAGNISAGASDNVQITLSHPPGQTFTVGTGKDYPTLAEAVAAAADGYLIEIDAGTYRGDVAVISQNNLTIRGVGGRAHLDANGSHVMGKGTLVIEGNDVTIENIEFSGASVPDENGAGIRSEGSNLALRNCSFHDNENGILGGAGDVLIEYCEFYRNGFGDGQTHNMYISNCRSFTLRYSYSHHAIIGHNVKSRAEENHILYNRIMDHGDGTASRAIDLPNGGRTFIIGNYIQQGPNTDNSNIIGYGQEGLSNEVNELYVSGNTIVNDRSGGTFLEVNANTSGGLAVNNLFVGEANLISNSGAITMTNNLHTQTPGFVDRDTYDYRLTSTSDAINNGVDPGNGGDLSLTPMKHYIYDLQQESRPEAGTLDIGAFEFTEAGCVGDQCGSSQNSPSGNSGGGGCFILGLH